MKWTFGLLLILLTAELNNGSFVQFGQMINTMSRLPPMAYNGYGNYCGLFGKGPPMDNIDRCCSAHDRCLSVTNRRLCLPLFYMSYFVLPYRWSMQGDHIVCSRTNTRCSQGLCDCDRLCAECFARYEDQYDPSMKRPMSM